MNAKKSEQGKHLPLLADDEFSVEEFSENDIGNFRPSITIKIQEFLEKQNLEDREPVFYLYKYDDYISGERKSFIAKYRDGESPDEDSIGIEHGAGRYLLCMMLPPGSKEEKDGRMRIYRFRVNQRYDKIKKEREALQLSMPVQQSVVQQIPGANFSDAFGMVEKVIALITPILNRPKDENIQDVMRSSYGMVNDIIKQNVNDSMKLIGDLQKGALMKGEPVETEAIEENNPSLLEQFAPILNEWLPKLLGGGPQGKAVSQVVQMTPQFQQVMKDKVELNRIIKYLKDTRGDKETAQILSALNIKRGAGAKRA